MGANMARRLTDAGYSVIAVYDLDPAKSASLGNELGWEAATPPARVAQLCTTIFTVITDDAGMRVLYAPQRVDRLLSHARGRLFINCATLSTQIRNRSLS